MTQQTVQDALAFLDDYLPKVRERSLPWQLPVVGRLEAEVQVLRDTVHVAQGINAGVSGNVLLEWYIGVEQYTEALKAWEKGASATYKRTSAEPKGSTAYEARLLHCAVRNVLGSIRKAYDAVATDTLERCSAG